MERESVSIEDIITSAQGSINDFIIKEKFQIISVRKKIAKNGTSYFSLTLKHKTGSLHAKRFTSGELEFNSINFIYLVGNIVKIEGIYQPEWLSIKIVTEKLVEGPIKEVLSENQNWIDKINDLIKITKFGTTIQIKSYVNDVINPYFSNASNKKVKEFKRFIEQHIGIWPEDCQFEFCKEYYKTIGRYEDMQLPKWKKWGSRLIQLISGLR